MILKKLSKSLPESTNEIFYHKSDEKLEKTFAVTFSFSNDTDPSQSQAFYNAVMNDFQFCFEWKF